MIFDDMEFGSYDKAERKARKAFELYEDGKMSQALDELETALEINPTNSSWHFDKALTLDAISRFDDAIREFEAALDLRPDDLEILNSLAVDYTRTGQYDLAIDTFEHMQEMDSTFEPGYCNRITAYTEMGLHDLSAVKGRQADLFDDAQDRQERAIDRVLDRVQERFGTDSLGHGRSVLETAVRKSSGPVWPLAMDRQKSGPSLPEMRSV